MTGVLAVLRRPPVALALDLLLVVVFAAIGRASHDEANPVVGVLVTAWPFLVGTVIGWVVVRLLRKSWPLEVGPGITIWFSTVLIGMGLRQATGLGTAATFVLVAAVVLALFLIGWRALVTLVLRRTRTSP